MKITTEEWRIHNKNILIFLGVILLIILGAVWFVSLGHVRLISKWWGKLKDLEDAMDKEARQYRLARRKEV